MASCYVLSFKLLFSSLPPIRSLKCICKRIERGNNKRVNDIECDEKKQRHEHRQAETNRKRTNETDEGRDRERVCVCKWEELRRIQNYVFCSACSVHGTRIAFIRIYYSFCHKCSAWLATTLQPIYHWSRKHVARCVERVSLLSSKSENW